MNNLSEKTHTALVIVILATAESYFYFSTISMPNCQSIYSYPKQPPVIELDLMAAQSEGENFSIRIVFPHVEYIIHDAQCVPNGIILAPQTM